MKLKSKLKQVLKFMTNHNPLIWFIMDQRLAYKEAFKVVHIKCRYHLVHNNSKHGLEEDLALNAAHTSFTRRAEFLSNNATWSITCLTWSRDLIKAVHNGI